jgi:RNA 2',3'-cyclic 3'-phosphodiesterase
MTGTGGPSASTARPASARVFFALWPDPAVQAVLHRHGQVLHRELGGKLTRADTVHLTLLFLGSVPEARLTSVQGVGEGVRFAPFSMRIDTAKCWRHNSIAWAGPSRIPSALLDLVAQLEGAASDAGFELDRRPYAAHVTLVRKARCRPLDIEPLQVEWPVREFVLVRSQLDPGGSRYSVIGRWAAS